MTALRSSCLCGGVRFEIDGPLMRSSHCHCRQRQKAHGAPFRTRTRFIVDKAPWFTVTDDLPQYPARIPGQNAPHNS
jgi:hypothetical protein